jgi:hypothetical protein
MSQICAFYGSTICIYDDDHPDPHFHAFYSRKR